MRAAICKLILRLLGWRIIGQVPDHLKKGVAIIAPHTSNWDFILGVLGIYTHKVSLNFLAKDSIFRFPFGGLLRAMGGIPVDRSKNTNLVDQIVAEFGKREVLRLALAPEGTRSKVTRWKTGFYHMAHKAGVPIVLTAIDYKTKSLFVGEVFYPTGNLEVDLAHIQDYYKDKYGKYPELGYPLPEGIA